MDSKGVGLLIGIGKGSPESDDEPSSMHMAAKALIKHLTTPEAAAVIKAKGMEPLGK